MYPVTTEHYTNCLVNQKRLDRAELYLENAISDGKPLSAAAVTALLQDFAKLENVEKPEFCMHRALLAGVQVPLRTLRFRQLFWATA
jgi:hypothetical protein